MATACGTVKQSMATRYRSRRPHLENIHDISEEVGPYESDSSDEDVAMSVVGPQRRAAIARREAKRQRLHAELEETGCLSGESMLEHIHVPEASRDPYEDIVGKLVKASGKAKLHKESDEVVDHHIVERMNKLFCRGLDVSTVCGRKLLSAWMQQ